MCAFVIRIKLQFLIAFRANRITTDIDIDNNRHNTQYTVASKITVKWYIDGDEDGSSCGFVSSQCCVVSMEFVVRNNANKRQF